MTRILFAVGVLVAFAVPDAHAGERVLASVARATPVNVFAGTVVWSDYRRGEGYRLMAWTGGRVRTLRIPPRRTPFDADLGPDRRGRTVVVYSRCRKEHPRTFAAPLGCRLYRYDLRAGREERLDGIGRRGHSDLHPSIWRGRVAFARYEDPAREEYPVLHRILVHDPGGRLQRVRGGTPAGAGVADPDGNVTAIDLRGDRLAFGWVFTTDGCESLGDDSKGFSPAGTEVWAVVLGGARRRVGDGCSDDGTAVYAPALTPRGLELTSYAPAANERVTLDRAGAERGRRPLGAAVAISGDGERVATVEPAGRRFQIVLRR